MNFKISKLSEKLFFELFRLILKLMLWDATSISRFLRGFFLILEICVGCGSLKNGQKRYKSKKLIKISGKSVPSNYGDITIFTYYFTLTKI